MGILPPGVVGSYDDNNFWAHALLQSYEHIREQEQADKELEEHEIMAAMLGAKVG